MFRIAVFADTHGNHKTIREALTACSTFDQIFHLGDGVNEGEEVAKEYSLPFVGIAGNEDYGSNYPDELRLEIQQIPFYLTHGCQIDMNPYQSFDDQEKKYLRMVGFAKQEQVSVVLFGHSHSPVLKCLKDVILCNPGDQYIGSQYPPTFSIIEIKNQLIRISILKRQKGNFWKTMVSKTLRVATHSRHS